MEIENEKTKLQRIKEQLEQKMTCAIVEAIEDGAKYEVLISGGLYIGGVYLTPKFGTEYRGLILDINAPEIEQLFEPTEEELKRRAEKLRAELTEIENKLKPNEQ